MSDFPSPPRYVALCGHPKSGKSTVQRILQNRFGILPVDDGRPLRDMAKMMFGLTEHQVTTQEGKEEVVDLYGVEFEVRDILGQVGEMFEERFSEYAVPAAVIRQVEQEYEGANILAFSLGSVRRDQGLLIKDKGGLVVEVRNPRIAPSPYEFDRYNTEVVDMVIDNDGDLNELERQVVRLFNPVYGTRIMR